MAQSWINMHNYISAEELNRIEIADKSPTTTLQTNNNKNQQFSKFYLNLNTNKPNSLYAANENATSFESLNIQQAPSNMMRRWSQHISHYAKDKQAIHEKTQTRLPTKKILRTNAGSPSSTSGSYIGEAIDELAEQIEQHESLMQNTLQSKLNRIEIVRTLPQPLYIRRILKWKLCNYIEQQQKFIDFIKANNMLFVKNDLLTVFYKQRQWLTITLRGIKIWRNSLHQIKAHFGCTTSTYFSFLRHLFVLNACVFLLVFCLIALPQITYNIKHKLNYFIMFYGSFSNEPCQVVWLSLDYSIQKAYFLTILLIYLATFIWISTRMTTVYRESFISTLKIHQKYAHYLFCAWDYRIATIKAAAIRYKSICLELRKMIETPNDKLASKNIVKYMQSVCLEGLRHFVVALLTLIQCLILNILCYKLEEWKTAWSYFFIGIAINFLIYFVDYILCWLASLESVGRNYSTMQLTVVRNFLAQLFLIGTLLRHWLTRESSECWESKLGQNVFSLLLADLLFSVTVVPLVYYLRSFVLRRFWPALYRPVHFNHTLLNLNLLYTQTLLWLGLLYAPLLVVLSLLKLLLIFYIQKHILFHCCQTPEATTLTDQSQSMQLVMLFFSLLCVFIVHTYTMTHIPLSSHCGPFRDYTYMFEVLINGILHLNSDCFISRLLMFVVRPAAIGVMLLILTIKAYYMYAKSNSDCKLATVLREMIHWEAKDKRFILSQIKRVRRLSQFDIRQDGFPNGRRESEVIYTIPEE